LEAELKKIEEREKVQDPDERARKKHMLLSKALSHFKQLQSTSTMIAHSLPDVKMFELTKTKDPEYFGKKFAETKVTVTFEKDEHYSYHDDRASGITDVWVDYANRKLGGGVFTDGFVQEEIMCMETPELANAAANNLDTRSGGEGPSEGSPEPWLFKGAHRVMEIQGVYGEEWKTTKIEQLDRDSALLPKDEQIIILAMAAPCVGANCPGGGKPEPKSWLTIRDLFNTFYAGFLLASDNPGGPEGRRPATGSPARRGTAGGRVRINTGPIGSGDFGNDKSAVYVLQRLAAEHAGVDIRFWAYNESESHVKDATAAYDSIVKDYNAASTKTIAKLLEIAQQKIEKLGSAGEPIHHRPHGRPRRVRR
jgi:hypothetical protein